MTASGISPLGVVKHLGFVEQHWFRIRFAGEEVALPELGATGDRSVEFLVEPEDTIDSIVAFYRDQCEQSRRVVDEARSLDQLSQGVSPHHGRVSLRWVLLHMLEEAARHTGHLDIMREALDGRTGD